MESVKGTRTSAPKVDQVETRTLQTLKEIALALSVAVEALGSAHLADVEDGTDFYEAVRRFEVALIQRALKQTGGNQAGAARLLNLKQTTLNEKIKRYNIYPANVIYYNDDSAACVNAHCNPLQDS
jgi:transcriptional regulator with GAF, ATPase, and Fis domain